MTQGSLRAAAGQKGRLLKVVGLSPRRDPATLMLQYGEIALMPG